MRRPSLPKRPSVKLPSLKLPKPGRKDRSLSPQAAAAAAVKKKPAATPADTPAAKPKSPRKLPPLKLIVPAAAAILVVVLLIGTCGSDEDKDVRDTLDRFAKATREKDYQALCDDLLSSKLVEQLRTADRPCEVVLRIGLSEVQNPTLEVLGVQINNDQATAQVDTGAAGQPAFRTRILLVREDGNWRLKSLPDEQEPAATP
jgi:hypothetical protein